MKFIKLASIASVVLALAGCGEKTKVSAAEGFSPIVAEGTAVALKYRKSDSPSMNILSDFFVKERAESIAEAMNHARGGREFAEFLEKSGLKDATIEWVLLSVGELTPGVIAGDEIPSVALAFCAEHDFARLSAAVKEDVDKAANGDSFEELSIPGAEAFRVVLTDGVGPSWASLDGKLLIASMSPERLAAEVALYREGKPSAHPCADFAADKLGVVKLFLPDLGKILRDANAGERLSGIDQLIPDGKNIILGLKSLDLALNAEPNLAVRIRLEAAKEEDAKVLESILNVSLMPLKAQLRKDAGAGSILAGELLAALTITVEGSVLKLDLPVTDDQAKRGLEYIGETAAEMQSAGLVPDQL